MELSLVKVDEPEILFRYDQGMEDPRDGLSLFGPLDEGNPYGIRTGVIGTRTGIKKFKEWLSHVHEPIIHEKHLFSRPFFPGFKAAFQTEWMADRIEEILLDENQLRARLYHEDQHYRVYYLVDIYIASRLSSTRRTSTQTLMCGLLLFRTKFTGTADQIPCFPKDLLQQGG